MAREHKTAFTIEIEKRGKAVVIRPHGRITELEAHDLNRELLAQAQEDVRRIVVDLNDVSFLTSSGLGAFMSAHKRGRERGMVLALASLQPLVHEIVTATKLHKLFPIFDTVEEAVGSPSA